MSSREIKCTLDRLIEVFSLLSDKEGYYYRNGMTSKNIDCILKKVKPQNDNFWRYGNNKIYIYHESILKEENPVEEFDNIHQGKIYGRSDMVGGFFFVITFFIEDTKTLRDASIAYATLFKIGDEWLAPTDEVKKRFALIYKKLKSKK